MSEYDHSIHMNPDAKAWAEFFMKTKEENNWSLADIDESLMIGWFANAMMAMHDHLHHEKITQLQTKLAESEARVGRLEGVITPGVIDLVRCGIGGNYGGEPYHEALKQYRDPLIEALNETPAQSLQHIEAEAVEKAKVSSQMKADCMGEISFVIENGNCCPQCWHEQDDDCDICHGESGENGSSDLLVQVPWGTMKDIWKMMNKSYSRQLRQQSNGSNGE